MARVYQRIYFHEHWGDGHNPYRGSRRRNSSQDVPVSSYRSARSLLRGMLDFGTTQTPTSCMVEGPSTLTSGYNVGGTSIDWRIDGGIITGCTGATTAGLESMPWMGHGYIENTKFYVFGPAGNTAGLCTKSSLKLDIIAEAHIDNSLISDGRAGACATRNTQDCGSSVSCTGATGGQNTLHMDGNTILDGTGANCGSIGHWEGGTHSTLIDNSFYGWDVPVLFANANSGTQAGGWMVHGGTYDSAGCVANAVSASFQAGHNGSAIAQGPITIMGAEIPGGSGHETNLFAIAGNSTDTITGVHLDGNLSEQNNTPLMPAATACTMLFGSSSSYYCYIGNNPGFSTGPVSCNTTATGWQNTNILSACATSAQTANLGATTLLTPVPNARTMVTCQVLITTAATTSSTLPTCSITYTDFFTNVSQTVQVTPTLGASATVGCNGTAVTDPIVGTSCQGTLGPIFPKAGVAISYSTAGYASVGGTAMQYQVLAAVMTD